MIWLKEVRGRHPLIRNACAKKANLNKIKGLGIILEKLKDIYRSIWKNVSVKLNENENKKKGKPEDFPF